MTQEAVTALGFAASLATGGIGAGVLQAGLVSAGSGLVVQVGGVEMINSIGRGEGLDQGIHKGIKKSLSKEGIERAIQSGIEGVGFYYGKDIWLQHHPESYEVWKKFTGEQE